jgi:hypothetical protein
MPASGLNTDDQRVYSGGANTPRSQRLRQGFSTGDNSAVDAAVRIVAMPASGLDTGDYNCSAWRKLGHEPVAMPASGLSTGERVSGVALGLVLTTPISSTTPAADDPAGRSACVRV